MPPPLTDLLDQVLEISLLVNQDMDQSLSEHGLTPARTHLLWEVFHRGPSTQRVLAEALDVSARNITGLVDGLETTGFVTREPHPTDRRASLVTLTARGAELMAEMAHGQQAFAQLLFGDLSPRQAAAMGRSLAHVRDRLRGLVPKGAPQ